MPPETKKPALSPMISVGGGVDLSDVEAWARKDPAQFAQRMSEMINKGEFTLRDIRDLKGLFFRMQGISVPSHVTVMGQRAAIQTSAFPLLMGNLMVAAINDGFMKVNSIGDKLVEDFEDSKKVTEIAAVYHQDNAGQTTRVDEGKEFPEIGAGEDFVEVRHLRNGRAISVTQETLEENNVAGLLGKINGLVDICTKFVEILTLNRVTDRYGSGGTPAEPYAYRPKGVGTQLYNSSVNSPSARTPLGTRILNNALLDASNLQAAYDLLAKNLDYDGDLLEQVVSDMILLVPQALQSTAQTILGSELTPGVANELNPWGPRGANRPTLLSSSRLNGISTGNWYLGDFKKQFVRKWKLRMEYVTMSGDLKTFLETRVAFKGRVAWDVEVAARNTEFVVQNLAGSTP